MNEDTQKIISKLSHDLKNPLAAMQIYLEMLTKGMAGELNQKQMDMLAEISDASDNMKNILNSVRTSSADSL